jgi:hypothetical protein
MEYTDKLGVVEFEETLIDLISPMILYLNYIKTYSEFWDNLVFKSWESYYYSKNNLPVSHYAKMFDIFFGCLFNFPSSTDKGLDIVFEG